MVNIKTCKQKQFLDDVGKRKIVCFGAGDGFKAFLQNDRDIKNRIECIIDNDIKLGGMQIEGIPIYSIAEFVEKRMKDIVVVITPRLLYIPDIVRQLDDIEFFDGVDCYVRGWISEGDGEFRLLRGKQKIPKKIHYCWFGKKEMPEHLRQYVETWKKFCPDYEIIKWDESNYDIKKNRYMLQAYESGKFGFVPDYARLDIIGEYGGIYLDTDVELIRNLDDLLCYDFYCGFESKEYIALGLGFGAVSGHPLISKMLEPYKKINFIENGRMNVTPSPKYQSEVMKKEGFLLNGMYQERGGAAIFPCEAFAPGGMLVLPDGVTKNTYSIHHYDGSWVDNRDERKRQNEALRKFYVERVLEKSRTMRNASFKRETGK